uniref:Heteropteran venom family 2 protein 9 n=1 Tax=Oncocephalus sp. TaxID=2944721 RepID=A0AB38ZEN5_9HEMI
MGLENKTILVAIICIFCFGYINGKIEFDDKRVKNLTPEELDVLEDAVQRQGKKFLSEFKGTVDCSLEDLSCTMCLGFSLAKKPHQICLIAGVLIEKLGAFITLTYDYEEIWNQEILFNAICGGLPKPLNNVSICLEAYYLSLLDLPEEATLCLRTELTLIFPLLSIDFNCVKYEKGKGLFFDWTRESESKALIDININGGDPIVSFNSPIPWELIEPILAAIQKERLRLQFELTQKIKEDLNKGSWWSAIISSIGAGATMGMGIR